MALLAVITLGLSALGVSPALADAGHVPSGLSITATTPTESGAVVSYAVGDNGGSVPTFAWLDINSGYAKFGDTTASRAFTVSGLPDGTYSAALTVQNVYGWSDPLVFSLTIKRVMPYVDNTDYSSQITVSAKSQTIKSKGYGDWKKLTINVSLPDAALAQSNPAQGQSRYTLDIQFVNEATASNYNEPANNPDPQLSDFYGFAHVSQELVQLDHQGTYTVKVEGQGESLRMYYGIHSYNDTTALSALKRSSTTIKFVETMPAWKLVSSVHKGSATYIATASNHGLEYYYASNYKTSKFVTEAESGNPKHGLLVKNPPKVKVFVKHKGSKHYVLLKSVKMRLEAIIYGKAKHTSASLGIESKKLRKGDTFYFTVASRPLIKTYKSPTYKINSKLRAVKVK